MKKIWQNFVMPVILCTAVVFLNVFIKCNSLADAHRYAQGQCCPNVPASFTKTTGCKTTVDKTLNPPSDISENPPVPPLHIVVLFSMRPCGFKSSVNEFWAISEIEIYWQNCNKAGCLPAWIRGSHCPECSEHMLLSRAACLTAKGWFNYINCLMTEERAAGPCMLVCDKKGTLQRCGPHYASLTAT